MSIIRRTPDDQAAGSHALHPICSIYQLFSIPVTVLNKQHVQKKNALAYLVKGCYGEKTALIVIACQIWTVIQENAV